MNDLRKFLNEEQDPKAVEKILGRINSLLTTNEQVEYIAVQKKPAITLSPDCIALTNKRIIFCKPKSFGLSMDFQDYNWKDVYDCHIKEGILGATFTMVTIRNLRNMMDYLPKNQARKLYQFAQEREEEMREYRRQKELEDKRAAAGGGIIVNNSTSAAPVEAPPQEDSFAVLLKLKNLLENGILSQEEFEQKKNEILARV
ncbi:PH domain-containing protein [Pedobacter riviphilus]|uniref:PH domain-containing protein n=1 Tax=Pedobacter riviphilus TaxID=2766984 RepID=A0ABX6TR11_9SPHI|nr:PH domain-containing protein [Pedobacter riviphilus]